MKLSQTKGFYIYLSIVFINAFVDLGHKILIQNTLYQTSTSQQYIIYSSLINAFILLPFLLLFTPAGFIADRFPKVNVLRIATAAAIPITMLITLSYYLGLFWIAFFLTLVLAAHTAIHSPAKYGYIKEAFGVDNIAPANAFTQTMMIIAILAGTFVFTLLFYWFLKTSNIGLNVNDKRLVLHAFAPLGFLLVTCSSIETVMTFFIPKQPAVDPSATYQVKKYFTSIYYKKFFQSLHHPTIIMCILGLSLFYAINQVLLASYGAFLKAYISPAVTVVFAQGSLTMGGIGFIFGALYSGKISRGYIEAGLIPLGAIGITLGLFLLPYFHSRVLIIILFFCYGVFGGFLVVPLNALIQFHARNRDLGKVLAGNNFVQTIFMLTFLTVSACLALLNMSPIILLRILFIIALTATIFAILRMPQTLIRYIAYLLVSLFYRLQVYNVENIPSVGPALLLGNHSSFIDWLVLQISCPRPIRFVMDRYYFNRWYLKLFLKYYGAIPIDKKNYLNMIHEISRALDQGELVAMFPEGRLSRNSQLGKFHHDFESAAINNPQAVIIPFYLHGLWGTRSSHAEAIYKRVARLKFRRISVIYGKPLKNNVNAHEVKKKIFELSITAWKHYTERLNGIGVEWFNRAIRLRNQFAVADMSGVELNYFHLITAVIFFSRKMKQFIRDQKQIGIMLPPSIAGVIANCMVFVRGKVVVNLNYTSGEQNLKKFIEKTGVETIITSRLFLDQLKKRGMDQTNLLNSYQLIYMEEYKHRRHKFSQFLYFMMVRILPRLLLQKLFIQSVQADDTAAIFMSSGSEGEAKAIELTHRNVLGNVKQVASVLNIQEDDRVLGSLPLFHAYGLTATTLLPMMSGIPLICYPDPLDAVGIGKIVYRYRLSIMAATSTILGIYVRNKNCDPLYFSTLRMVIAGAEKLSELVRMSFKQRFGVDIYEGYGATEVSPIATVNLPDEMNSEDWHIDRYHKPGTVGLPLPGTAIRVVNPETLTECAINEDGLILIGGTQVMRGYLNDKERTEKVLIREENITWYKSGDKGHLDQDGFLSIVDRYSRFAKIAGEMVSLTAVEEFIQKTLEPFHVDCIALAKGDVKKGEIIVVLYEGDIDEIWCREKLIRADMPALYLPQQFVKLTALPKLGTGKKDYQTAKQFL